MNRPMRRRDRAASAEKAWEILERAPFAVIAINGTDGWPYAVSVSYALIENRLYFHSAMEGMKVDCLAADGRVCVSAVAQQRTLPEEMSVAYQSAVGFGRAELVTDAEERRAGLMAICAKYAPDNPNNERESANCTRAKLYRIVIEELTGKIQIPESN